MPRHRATASSLELSGRDKKCPAKYANYNFTAGVPITDIVEIKPPRNLSRKAKEAWKLTVTALLKMRALSETDLVNLLTMFQVYDEMLKADAAIKSFDIVHPVCLTKDDINDRKMLNTWFIQSARQFNSMSREFGLTPASRTTLPMTQNDSKKDADPLSQIIGD